ncbi:ribonuclease R [Roseateles chitosanitabidus]|uniref:ribonuclease R n=1 Tax=Roseateles chitosanitabidus TaxID=65048 RepID=UPI0023534A8C|nr:ribonuclease R [Roseateles chitosanitabidus]
MKNFKNASPKQNNSLMGEVEGTVQGHRDGHGFLMPDDGQPDVYLSSQEMHAVMHGDRLRVRVVRLDKRGRPEGRVLEILERRKKPIIGRLLLESGIWLVAPEDKRYGQDILVPKNAIANATAGQIVAVELTEPPSLYSQPVGRVTEVLGEIDDPGMEIEIAVRKYEVPHAFSADTLAQAAKLPDRVRAADMKNRIDLRDVALVTIDGEDARDFDDAVYCEPHKQGRGKTAFKGWRLLVAIADVSHYVKPGEPLDRDAYERATSVYFPRRVIPMLPEKLSNGLCSLNPEQDRLSMVCDMLVTEEGELHAYQFYPAVINSHARFTYTEVAAILGNTHGPEAHKRKALVPHLLHLHEVYRALLSQRAKRGAVDFETTETQIVCDDNGRIEKIVPRTRNEAHRLIEEAMLAANVCAADFIAGGKHASLFRVHEGPTPEKRGTLQAYLRALGIGMGISDDPTPGEFQAIAQATKDRPDAQQIHTMLLRSMQQAIYTPFNSGHFGLAYQAYTHFTSPIRRYPDLLVHRVIKALLGAKKYALDAHKMEAANPMPKRPGKQAAKAAPTAASASTEAERWEVVGAHCSANERRADEASRDVEAWLKCRYMRDHLGEEFAGTVSAVTSFGLFVQLDAMYVEGLIHITELGGEYFRFDEVRQELRGERTGIRYATGARVQVQVSRVDLDGRKIDFRLVRDGDEARLLRGAHRDKFGDKHGGEGKRFDKRADKRARRDAASAAKSAPPVDVEPMPLPTPDAPTAVDALERIEQADRVLQAERRKTARATKSSNTHPVKAAKRTARGPAKSVVAKSSAGAAAKTTRRKRGGAN